MSSANQPPTEEDHFGELYHQLHHFYYTSDYARALQAGTELLSQEPEDAYLHYRVGECLRMLGDRQQAIVHLKKSLSLAPDYADALNALGLCHLANNKAGLAYDHINKAVSLDPEDAFNWYAKGLCHLAFEQPKKILECAQKICQLAPESTWSTDLEVRAKFDLTQGTTFSRQERLEIILQALEREPENASFHGRISELKLKEFGQIQEAETHAREALRLEPGDTDYRKLLIQVLREKDPVLRTLRLPLFPRNLLNRLHFKGKHKVIFYSLLIGFSLIALIVAISFDEAGAFALLLWIPLILLISLLILYSLSIAIYAVLCWPIAKAYEYLTIADVYKKAGDLSFYSKPMARFHQGPFALRMAVFSLIPLGLWTLLLSLFVFPNAGISVAAIAIFAFRIAGIGFLLVTVGSMIRKAFHKLKTR